MNFFRSLAILPELDKDSFAVSFYRFSGLAGILIFIILLIQAFQT